MRLRFPTTYVSICVFIFLRATVFICNLLNSTYHKSIIFENNLELAVSRLIIVAKELLYLCSDVMHILNFFICVSMNIYGK